MTRQKYSEEFKDSIITKYFNRGGQSIEVFCRQEGVSKSAMWRWQQERDNGLEMKAKNKELQWTAQAKLNAIIKSQNLGEEDLGVYLRQEGLHSHQVNGWRADILSVLGPSFRKPRVVKDGRDEKILGLEKDLRRKDKALAEASALLILQKKVNLIWGSGHEDEK